MSNGSARCARPLTRSEDRELRKIASQEAAVDCGDAIGLALSVRSDQKVGDQVLPWSAHAAVSLENAASQACRVECRRTVDETQCGEAVGELAFIEEDRKEFSRHDVTDDQLALGSRLGQEIDPPQ